MEYSSKNGVLHPIVRRDFVERPPAILRSSHVHLSNKGNLCKSWKTFSKEFQIRQRSMFACFTTGLKPIIKVQLYLVVHSNLERSVTLILGRTLQYNLCFKETNIFSSKSLETFRIPVIYFQNAGPFNELALLFPESSLKCYYVRSRNDAISNVVFIFYKNSKSCHLLWYQSALW